MLFFLPCFFRFLPALPCPLYHSLPQAQYDILMECAQTPIMPVDERKYIHCILMIYTNVAATTCPEVLEPDSRAGGKECVFVRHPFVGLESHNLRDRHRAREKD